MDIYGEKVNRLIGELGRLPGIGGKTAQRLAFHIINMPEEQVESLSAAITDAKKNIRYCKSCYTITDQELCPVCASPKRNHKLIMVVETPRDLAAYERVGQYQGVYHVLNGVINPAMGIGTGDIRLKELILRLEQEDVEELIMQQIPVWRAKRLRCIYPSWSSHLESRSQELQVAFRSAAIWNVLMK